MILFCHACREFIQKRKKPDGKRRRAENFDLFGYEVGPRGDGDILHQFIGIQQARLHQCGVLGRKNNDAVGKHVAARFGQYAQIPIGKQDKTIKTAIKNVILFINIPPLSNTPSAL